MPWTIEEIEKGWLGGETSHLPEEDVLRAFDAAERVRGREWIVSTTVSPGGGHLWGFSPFMRVYEFGRQVQFAMGAPGAETMLHSLREGDHAAESELTAIYLLRSRCPATEVEIGPEVLVGRRNRRPDFRIRRAVEPWMYVEVTRLNRSMASATTQEALNRIAGQVISVLQPFLLEIVFWRDPTKSEEDELVKKATEACNAADGTRHDVGDLASIMVKSGDASLVVLSILPQDDSTPMSLS